MQIHEFHNECEASIVFLHGANAGGWMWEKVIRQLPDHHCIAVDMPGHADSNALEWTSPEEVAGDTAQIIRDRAHGGLAYVVGMSLGGLVALHLVAQCPAILHGVLVTGVPAAVMPNQWLKRILGAAVTPFIHSEKLLSASARAARIPQQDISHYVQQARRNSKSAFRRINNQAVDFAPPDAALDSQVSKTFVAGQRDHPTIVESLEEFAKAQHSRSYLVQELGHAWGSENPELFSDVVRCWVSGEPMPASVSEVGGKL